MFIAGGTGIAVALSYLSSLLAEDGDSQVVDIHIIWAVREEAFWREVLQRDIKRRVLRDERLRVMLHVTRTVEDGVKDMDDVTESAHEVWRPGPEDMGNVEVKAGRPDVTVAVMNAAQETGRSGRLAVVACGPAQMADEARSACVRVLAEGYSGVEYFQESFKW